MTDSRVGALLRDRGVGTDLSVSEAHTLCGVSETTIRNLMRGTTKTISEAVLAKIADGLGINRDLLQRARLIDLGYMQVESGSSVAEALEKIRGLSLRDRDTVLVELAQMQRQARATDQAMRDRAASAE
jgi:transcriptional regulator with XRE-family HTH domain